MEPWEWRRRTQQKDRKKEQHHWGLLGFFYSYTVTRGTIQLLHDLDLHKSEAPWEFAEYTNTSIKTKQSTSSQLKLCCYDLWWLRNSTNLSGNGRESQSAVGDHFISDQNCHLLSFMLGELQACVTHISSDVHRSECHTLHCNETLKREISHCGICYNLASVEWHAL